MKCLYISLPRDPPCRDSAKSTTSSLLERPPSSFPVGRTPLDQGPGHVGATCRHRSMRPIKISKGNFQNRVGRFGVRVAAAFVEKWDGDLKTRLLIVLFDASVLF